MDILAIIGLIAAVIGIPAAIVQVLDYLQKRRKRKEKTVGQEPHPPALPYVPHNLPPRSAFIGRQAEKARVHEALRSRFHLVSIDGIGGVGKTALALEVAHECLYASKSEATIDGVAAFDGFIWVTAQDRDLMLNDLLDAIAQTLEYPGIAQQPPEEKREAVRKLLREKPYLVIVDNFETVTDNDMRNFLLQLPEPSKALITSREHKLRQAWAISLMGLEQSEALALMCSEGQRLGLAALERAEDRALLHLYRATGGAPLAIKWAVGQIKQRGQSMDTILAALHEARGNIFDHIFARSWSLLSATARQVLVVMPLFATSASRAGIEAASNVHYFALDEALGQLVEMSLVDVTDELDQMQRRYSVHPLTRAFATAKLQQEQQKLNAINEFAREAQDRLKKYITNMVYNLCTTRYWHSYLQWRNYNAFASDFQTISLVFEQAYQSKDWRTVIKMYNALVHYLARRSEWEKRVDWAKKAIIAARAKKNYEAEAWYHIDALGWVYLQRGDTETALKNINEGENVAKRYELLNAIAQAACHRSKVLIDQGDKQEAQKAIETALLLEKKVSPIIRRHILTFWGDQLLLEGKLDMAKKKLVEAMDLCAEIGDETGQSYVLLSLGELYRIRGSDEMAYSCFEKALEFERALGRSDGIARAQQGFAKLAIQKGNYEEAILLGSEAARKFDRLGMNREATEMNNLISKAQNSVVLERNKD